MEKLLSEAIQAFLKYNNINYLLINLYLFKLFVFKLKFKH